MSCFCRRTIQQCLVLALLVCPILASENDFRIDSYIPERFEDLEWRLTGGGNVGSRSENNDYLSDSRGITTSTYGSSRSNWGLKMESLLRYRHYTIPDFFTLDVATAGAVNRSTSETESGPFADPLRSTYRRERNGSRYDAFDGKVSLEHGKYVKSDFFVSARGRWNGAYNAVADEKRDGLEESSDRYSQDTVRFVRVTSHEDSYRDQKSTSVQAEITPGWGRIYDGQYAATALYIAQELRRLGALRQDLDSSLMAGLCDIIYQHRLKHIIDSRYHRQQVLIEIISYLQNSGAVGNLDALSAFAVHDAWEYYPTALRQFGFAVRAGGGYQYQFRANQHSSRYASNRLELRYPVQSPSEVDTFSISRSEAGYYNNDKSDQETGFLISRIEWHKPVNLRWQLDGTALLTSDFNWNYITESVKRSTRESYGGSIELTAKYLVDARTSVALSFNGTYDHARTTSYSKSVPAVILADDTNTEWSVAARGTFVYRISVPTTLNFSLRYQRNGRELDRIGSHENRVNSLLDLAVGIEHYLF